MNNGSTAIININPAMQAGFIHFILAIGVGDDVTLGSCVSDMFYNPYPLCFVAEETSRKD